MPDIPDAPPGWYTAESAALHQARTDGGLRARIAAALWTRDYQPGPEAEIGGYVYDIADRVAGVVEELVEQARREAAKQIAHRIQERRCSFRACNACLCRREDARVALDAFPKETPDA